MPNYAQYIDDAAYIAQRSARGEEAPSLGQIARGWVGWDFSYHFLKMMSKSPRSGYFVPWTRVQPWAKPGTEPGWVARQGRKLGLWGEEGACKGTVTVVARMSIIWGYFMVDFLNVA